MSLAVRFSFLKGKETTRHVVPFQSQNVCEHFHVIFLSFAKRGNSSGTTVLPAKNAFPEWKFSLGSELHRGF